MTLSITTLAAKISKNEYNKKSGKKGDAYDTTDLKGQGGSLSGASRDVTGTKSVPNELAPIGKMSCAYRQNVLRL